MKKIIPALLGMTIAVSLVACEGSSSSGTLRAKESAVECLQLLRNGEMVEVTNHCNRDLSVRFFAMGDKGRFDLAADNMMAVDRSLVNGIYGACYKPFNPSVERQGRFSCNQ